MEEVEIRLRQIRSNLRGFEWTNEEESNKIKNTKNEGDINHKVEKRNDDDGDNSDREYDEEELAELMQQR